MALTIAPIRDPLNQNPRPAALSGAVGRHSLPMKSIGRQPSFTHLSDRCLIAKGGIQVPRFKPISLDSASDSGTGESRRNRLGVQSPYYRLQRHAQSAAFDFSPAAATPSGSIVPFAEGRKAWMRSLRGLHAARWREMGYDPDEEQPREGVRAALPVILDGSEDEDDDLSPQLRRLLGRCPNPVVALVLSEGSMAGCDRRDAHHVVLELQRLLRRCTDPDDADLVQAALDTVRAEWPSGAAMAPPRPFFDITDGERSALAAAERRFHEGIRRLQQNWTGARGPSAALIAMRRTAERMMAGHPDSMIARQIAAKEAEELADGYRTSLEALRSQYEAEKQAIRRAFRETRANPARRRTTRSPADPIRAASRPSSPP
jgi:hypothetical protein